MMSRLQRFFKHEKSMKRLCRTTLLTDRRPGKIERIEWILDQQFQLVEEFISRIKPNSYADAWSKNINNHLNVWNLSQRSSTVLFCLCYLLVYFFLDCQSDKDVRHFLFVKKTPQYKEGLHGGKMKCHLHHCHSLVFSLTVIVHDTTKCSLIKIFFDHSGTQKRGM